MFTQIIGVLAAVIPLVSAAACPAPCFNKCAMAVKPTDVADKVLAVADCMVFVQDQLTGLLPEYVVGKCKSEKAYVSACACIAVTSTIKPTVPTKTVSGSVTAVTQTTAASESVIMTRSTASVSAGSGLSTTTSSVTTVAAPSSSVTTPSSVEITPSILTTSSINTVSSVADPRVTTSSGLITTTTSSAITTSSAATTNSVVTLSSSVATTSSSIETTPSSVATTSNAIASELTPSTQTMTTTSSASLTSASGETSSEVVATTTSAAPPVETQFRTLQITDANGNVIDTKITLTSGTTTNAYVNWNPNTVGTPGIFEFEPATGRLFVTLPDGTVLYANSVFPSNNISGEALSFRRADHIDAEASRYYSLCTRDADGYLVCESEGGQLLEFAQIGTVKNVYVVKRAVAVASYKILKVRPANPPPAPPPAASTV